MRKAASNDLPAILSLLDASHLPTAGVAQALDSFIFAEEGNKLVGVTALERYGSAALLRSVAVREDQRGGGLGQRLTQYALDQALADGIEQVVLLTTTAAGFFPRLGFRLVGRDEVPEAVRQSVEFTSACPTSATVMLLDLNEISTGRVV